jgi:hypothetical protein
MRFRSDRPGRKVSGPAPAIPLDARPQLSHGVRLVYEEASRRWVLLSPKRAFKADSVAAEIVNAVPAKRLLTQSSTISPKPIRPPGAESSSTSWLSCGSFPTRICLNFSGGCPGALLFTLQRQHWRSRRGIPAKHRDAALADRTRVTSTETSMPFSAKRC